MKKLIMFWFALLLLVGLASGQLTLLRTDFNNSLTEENLTLIGDDLLNGTRNYTRWLNVSSTQLITDVFINLTGFPSTLSFLGFETTGVFWDDFNRANSVSLGNNWTQDTRSTLNNSRLLMFDPSAAQPAVSHNASVVGNNVKGLSFSINITGTGAFLYLRNSSGRNWILLVFESDNELYAYKANSPNVKLGNWNDNQWYDVQIQNISNSSFTYDVYLDNVLVGTNLSFNDGNPTTVEVNLDEFRMNAEYTPTGYIEMDNVSFSTNYSLPHNASIDVGADGSLDYVNTSYLDGQVVESPNLVAAVNAYLTSCTPVGGICNIPFTFSSITPGVLQYLQMLFTNDGLIENSQTFTPEVYDTDRQDFNINVTLDSNYYQTVIATLYYNGTSYLASTTDTGNERIYTRSVDIPVVSSTQNHTFYWEFTLTNATGSTTETTDEDNQTVSPSSLIQCGAGTKAINYTIFDEGTLGSAISGDFEGTLSWRLHPSSTVTKNTTVDLTGSSNYDFCINVNETFYTDTTISYSATGYVTRIRETTNELFTNVTTHIALRLLNESDSSNVIIEVKNSGLAPLEGYTVKIYRLYPQINEYREISSSETDIFGQFMAKLVQNDVKYRFEFYDTDGTLVRTAERTNIICRTTICVMSFIIPDTADDFVVFEDIPNHDFSLNFDNATNVFTFTWNDNTGNASVSHRLEVYRIELNGTNLVAGCNTTSSALSDTITCSVGSQKASYVAQAFRTADGTERRIDFETARVGDTASIFGVEGLFWALILLLILVSIGIFSPVVAIVLYLVGMLALSISGIVYISPAIQVAFFVLGVLFIWAFRT